MQDRDLGNARLRRTAAAITGIYCILTAGWMLGAFLTSVAATREELLQARAIKDLLFIVISGVALHTTLYHTMRHMHHSKRALEAERALRHSNDHLRSVIRYSPMAVITQDTEGRVSSWNQAAQDLFGWSEIEVHGQADPSVPPEQVEEARLQRQRVLKAQRIFDLEVRRMRKDGTPLEINMAAAPLYSADQQAISHVIYFCADISERKRQSEKVQHLATHDPLTNLPNRRILEDHLGRVIERAKRGQPAALLMLDLDSFKAINDQLGHLIGDQFLIHISHELEKQLRAGDVLTRFGGDEFAMLLENVSPATAHAVAERIRNTIATSRFSHSNRTYDTSVSIGVAPIDAESDARGIMVMADTALLIAKDGGKNRAMMYDRGNSVFAKLNESALWATRVKEALRENRFVLYFQPVVRINTGEAEHYEALVRMRDVEGNVIAPAAFIQAAEQFGLMPRIDQWVVEEVLRTLKAQPKIRIFMNLSGTSLTDQSLLDFIETRARAGDLPSGRLVFEITETAAVTDLHNARQWMVRLSQLGCEFALDDFGVAFSSFTYLRELPVQYVKLDGSFVKNLGTDACDRAMVQALNTIAHSLGKKVVAEWVESAAIADILRELGTEFGQGYYWGRPAPQPAEPVASTPAVIAAPRSAAA